MSDKETFQIEFDTKKDQWRVRTADNVYWKVADASGIQATDDGRSVNLYSRRTYHGQIQDLLVGYAHGSLSVSVIRIATKIKHLVNDPFPTFFENFTQKGRSEVFAQSC